MTGTPNELRVHWAQDSELVAEDAGSMLQPPLYQHGDHGPKGPEGETVAPTRSEVEDENAISSSCHGFGVRQVMDTRHFQRSVVENNEDLVIKAFCGQETNQTRPSAKLWTEFSTLQAPMDPTRSEMVQAEAAFNKA
jgi:hypothetical protein